MSDTETKEELHHHHHEHNITKNIKATFVVIVFTVITMVFEIFFGIITNSMALLADGWHMGTHAFALMITFAAYLLIENFKDKNIFQSGVGKVSDLAGYTSAIFLGITGIVILLEAVNRFFNPLSITFNEAIIVAVIGFIVNGICLLIMFSGENRDKDYNFKAAYLHIAADTLTSILAIFALLMGKYFGIIQLDSIVGILGGLLILKWATGLLSDTTKRLVEYKKID
ncbi:cation transporter [bacterium]|nr:cation transporter [bacterium]